MLIRLLQYNIFFFLQKFESFIKNSLELFVRELDYTDCAMCFWFMAHQVLSN